MKNFKKNLGLVSVQEKAFFGYVVMLSAGFVAVAINSISAILS